MRSVQYRLVAAVAMLTPIFSFACEQGQTTSSPPDEGSGSDAATAADGTGDGSEATSLLTPVASAAVTPSGDVQNADFARCAYVPGRDAVIVSFRAKIDPGVADCPFDHAYAYREYTEDLEPTGNDGFVTCEAGPDVGGAFVGDDFYYASMGRDRDTNTVDGWYMARFDAVTWEGTPIVFHPLTTGEQPGDPLVAMVNGQLDVSSLYMGPGSPPMGPFASYATFHALFTPDLQFLEDRILADKPHVGIDSLIVANDTIQFVAGTALIGDMIVMQYDTSWSYLGSKTLMTQASAPEGVAFDGQRFYVSYVDALCDTFPCINNVHLAAFDERWNLLEETAVTHQDRDGQLNAGRPTLTLHDQRLYVCWDQNDEDPSIPQIHVAAYDLSNE